MTRSHCVSIIAGVALLSTIPPVVAATDPVRYDDEVVVTATTKATPRKDTAKRSEVIAAKEIAARQAVEVSTVLASLPSLTVAQSGSPGKATSVFVRGAESDQVLVMWNGVRLNDPFFGGFDWAHLTTDGLERVEVIYGPSGVVYGSDGVGGVVNLVTTRDRSPTAVLEAGSDGYGRASAGGAWQREGLAVEGSLFWRADDGVEQQNDDYRVAGADLRASLRTGLGSELGLLVRSSDHDLGIPAVSGFASPNRRQRGSAWQVAVPWDWTKSAWSGQLLMTGHLSQLEFRDPDAFFSASDTEARRMQMRATVRRDGAGGHYAAGMEAFVDTTDNSSNFGVTLADVERRQRAFFVEGAWWLGQRAMLEAGARYDDDQFFSNQWTVRSGLLLQWSRQWSGYARYGEGFRTPSLGELFFPFFGNQDLKPESGQTTEWGVRHTDGHWTLELGHFDSDFEQLIDSDPVTFLAVNRSDAASKGWEASWVLRKERYASRASWSVLDTADNAGDPLLRRPNNAASVGVTRYGERWTVDASLRHVGSRADLDPLTFSVVDNPSYGTAHLAVARGLAWGEIRVRVENLFDKQYQQVLGFDSLGRRWVVGFKWQ